ncbi:MAG: ABC transporter ATP-binding protein [Pelovirga sp.]
MKPLISLHGILLQRGNAFVLRIDDLDLLPGRIYSLVGANGTGKSTLLQALALQLDPAQGVIAFPASPQLCARQLRQRVTLVEQNPYLFAGTVADNLRYGLQLRRLPLAEQQERITRALAAVGMAGFARRRARELSSGERQRVAIARALVLQPEVLLLDEPTANIDSVSLPLLESLIRTLPQQGMTVVCTTHDPAQPERLGAEVLSLGNGRLEAR